MAKDIKEYEVIRTFSIDNVIGRVGETVELNAEQAKAVANFVKGGTADARPAPVEAPKADAKKPA